MPTRLFFGFEYDCHLVHVIALDPSGRAVLRATYPVLDRLDTDLDHGAATDLAHSLVAFVHAHHALPVCGTDEDPPILEALAKRLGGTVRYLSDGELDHTAAPGFPLHARRVPGGAAHQRALLAGLAAGEGLRDVSSGQDL
jgi:hypothetical protein